MTAAEHEFLFTDQDFSAISQLVYDHAGIVLSEVKKHMVYSRLTRRVRALNLPDFATYVNLVRNKNHPEFTHFIDAITTNLTSFFREPHHFDYLRDEALPEIMARNRSSRSIRIWSAGCSFGEETYSIAITLLEALGLNSGWDVKILASDIDTKVLDVGRSGTYQIDRVKGLPTPLLKRYFQKGKGQHAGLARVHKPVRNLVTFKQINLMTDWPMQGPFDIIFCRNVVIYFDKPTQTKLFDRMANIMHPDGLLFIGHSESLYKVTDRFKLLGKTIYRRVT